MAPAAQAHNGHSQHRPTSQKVDRIPVAAAAEEYKAAAEITESDSPGLIESLAIASETSEERLVLYTVSSEIRYFFNGHDECCGWCETLDLGAGSVISISPEKPLSSSPGITFNVWSTSVSGTGYAKNLDLVHSPPLTTTLEYRVLLI